MVYSIRVSIGWLKTVVCVDNNINMKYVSICTSNYKNLKNRKQTNQNSETQALVWPKLEYSCVPNGTWLLSFGSDKCLEYLSFQLFVCQKLPTKIGYSMILIFKIDKYLPAQVRSNLH